MDEGIDALIRADRTLVIAIQGPRGTGKTCLARLIHGDLGFNQRYFLDPAPRIITSVYSIGGVSYLVQTIEHATAPCHAILRVNAPPGAGIIDHCCGVGVHSISVATRADVDSPCLETDFYSSFSDGYIVSQSNFKRLQALRNDLLIDWKRVYYAYGIRDVYNNHVQHFFRNRFGVVDLMTFLLYTRANFYQPDARFYTSAVFREERLRRRRFYKCCAGTGAIIISGYMVTLHSSGECLGLVEVLVEEIPFRQMVTQLPYVLAFHAFFEQFNFVSQIIEVEHMHFGMHHLLATASVENAEFLLSFLPEGIEFTTFPRLMATPDGRTPIFEFNYSFGLFGDAKVQIYMMLEHCERLSPFDQQCSAFYNDFVSIVHNVFVEKDLSIYPRHFFILPMLRTFGYKLPALHRISQTLVRVVDFQYSGRITNPRIMNELLCSDMFQNCLQREFLGFAAKHMHVLEPVQQYHIALYYRPQEAVIRRICAQRRGRFRFVEDILLIEIPVIEEPGIENYFDHCFADFQVLGTRIVWQVIACQHNLPAELPEYKSLLLARPSFLELGDRLLLKMTLENYLYGR